MRKNRNIKNVERKRIIWYAVIISFLFISFNFGAMAEEETNIILEIPGMVINVKIEVQDDIDPAEGYIHQQLYPRRNLFLRGSLPTGLRLTGANSTIYLKLYEKAVSVAAGEEESAGSNSISTIVRISAADVYGKLSYTAEELNVNAIVNNGSITTEAYNKISEILGNGFSNRDIMNCLMADLPYEMYWYDKTTGVIVSYPQIAVKSNDGIEYIMEIKGDVTFYLAVASEYRDSSPMEEIQGSSIYCHVSTTWGQSVKLAAANARQVVEQYEELNDVDRLKAYRDEIRNLTEYNYDAASGGYPYGNPWQLIWVFDGNPDTTVVCEGYSKAFQYLNDLSSSSVTVISVTGTMRQTNPDASGGPHMWNIVKMKDGKNYLADITNCFTSGGVDYLFLSGYQFQSQDGMTYGYPWGESMMYYTYDDSNSIHLAEDLAISDHDYTAIDLYLPEGLTTIENGAFAGIPSGLTVYIPEDVSDDDIQAAGFPEGTTIVRSR